MNSNDLDNTKKNISKQEFIFLENVCKFFFDEKLKNRIDTTVGVFKAKLEEAMEKLPKDFIDEIETLKKHLFTFRNDLPTPGDNILTNTKTQYNYFVVPKVLASE